MKDPSRPDPELPLQARVPTRRSSRALAGAIVALLLWQAACGLASLARHSAATPGVVRWQAFTQPARERLPEPLRPWRWLIEFVRHEVPAGSRIVLVPGSADLSVASLHLNLAVPLCALAFPTEVVTRQRELVPASLRLDVPTFVVEFGDTGDATWKAGCRRLRALHGAVVWRRDGDGRGR